jgi:hypothetical protein
MARMNIVLDEELGTLFEEYAAKRFGYKKGNKKKAAEEAIKLWIAYVDNYGDKSTDEASQTLAYAFQELIEDFHDRHKGVI